MRELALYLCTSCGRLQTGRVPVDALTRPPCPDCRHPLARLIEGVTYYVTAKIGETWYRVDGPATTMAEYQAVVGNLMRNPRVVTWRVLEEEAKEDGVRITVRGPRQAPDETAENAGVAPFRPPDPGHRMIFANLLSAAPEVTVTVGDEIVTKKDQVLFLSTVGGERGVYSVLRKGWLDGHVAVVDTLIEKRPAKMRGFFDVAIAEHGQVVIYDVNHDEIICPSILVQAARGLA